MHHSGGHLKSALDGWMYTGASSASVLWHLPRGSRRAACRKNPAPHAVAGPRPGADNVVLVPEHDPEKLRAHVPRAAHVLCVDEVPRAPRVAEAARFPGVVGGEERQVVALWLVEGRFLRVGLRLFVPRAVEDAWN